jgi:hypothetical protein
MLIRFKLTRKDNGQPIQGARIEVEKAETVGFTDSQGKAELVTFWSGNWMYNITASGYEKINGTLNNRDIPVLDLSWTMLYNAISPPSIPGPSEESIGRVGTSCSIIRNTSFGQSFFQIRHDRSGNVTSLHSDLPEVRGIGNRTAACFEVPPPPPKTTDELGSELTTLQKLLNGAVGKIDNLVQGISDIAGKVETEAADRLKGLLDLEVKLKSWIVDGILDIIWTALTREHKGA